MKNIKINTDRPKVSSEEIASRQDFKSVISKHHTTSQQFYKKPGGITGIIVTTVVVVSSACYYYSSIKTTVTETPVTTIRTVKESKPVVHNEAEKAVVQSKTEAPEKTANKVVPQSEKVIVQPKKETSAKVVAKSVPPTGSSTQGVLAVVSNENTSIKKPFIAPPLKNVNVKYNKYKVSATKGGEITHKTGSKIKFPAAAFVDAKGKTVNGDVDIDYREFHGLVDVFVSGIPMTYDSAGRQYNFESAGMMDIRGYQDGKQVYVAPGKKIEVQMTTDKKDSRFNMYYLDTVKRNWTFMGKNKMPAREEPKSADPNKWSSDSISTPVYGEASTISSTTKIDESSQKELSTLSQKAKEAKQARSKLETDERPVEPRKATLSRHRFNVEVDAKEFPELTVYKNVLFEVGDNNKNFNIKYYDIVWDDATVKEGLKKGVDYTLTLTKGEQVQKINVYPVFEGKDYEVAKKEYEQKFQQYTTRLTQRKDEEKKAEEIYLAKVEEVKRLREEQEKKWKADEADRVAQWKKSQEQAFATADNHNKFYSAFTISGFGTFNSDCPHVFPKGEQFSASFKDENGKSLSGVSDVMLVEIGRNIMFTYHPDSQKDFRYDPNVTNALWTATSNGKLAVYTSDKFSEIPKSQRSYTFKLKVIDQEITSVEEVKKILGVQ